MRLRIRGAIASLAVGIIALALGTAPARAADDPALDQTVAADEEASTESAVIGTGHVDIGPRMVDGQWSVALRDDSGAHPVWRDPDRTVLRVSDAALMAAPTGSDYAFMGAQAGEQYYVVPQTQNPDVVWLGWNTQDPGVVSAIDRGATMRIGSVSGPGRTWMFLQDGTFGKPRLLVDGQSGQAQDVWVDASTHVHANWVFTAPGVYTAALTFSARTTDGRQVSASTTLRFAVGSQTSADEAFAAAPAGAAEAGATVLLSSHILAEVQDLCSHVTIIKDGRTVESGDLLHLRSLAKTAIRIGVGEEDARRPRLVEALAGLGAPVRPTGTRVETHVPSSLVPKVLGVVAELGADDVQVEPASLEDLFMSHYSGDQGAQS